MCLLALASPLCRHPVRLHHQRAHLIAEAGEAREHARAHRFGAAQQGAGAVGRLHQHDAHLGQGKNRWERWGKCAVGRRWQRAGDSWRSCGRMSLRAACQANSPAAWLAAGLHCIKSLRGRCGGTCGARSHGCIAAASRRQSRSSARRTARRTGAPEDAEAKTRGGSVQDASSGSAIDTEEFGPMGAAAQSWLATRKRRRGAISLCAWVCRAAHHLHRPRGRLRQAGKALAGKVRTGGQPCARPVRSPDATG